MNEMNSNNTCDFFSEYNPSASIVQNEELGDINGHFFKFKINSLGLVSDTFVLKGCESFKSSLTKFCDENHYFYDNFIFIFGGKSVAINDAYSAAWYFLCHLITLNEENRINMIQIKHSNDIVDDLKTEDEEEADDDDEIFELNIFEMNLDQFDWRIFEPSILKQFMQFMDNKELRISDSIKKRILKQYNLRKTGDTQKRIDAALKIVGYGQHDVRILRYNIMNLGRNGCFQYDLNKIVYKDDTAKGLYIEMNRMIKEWKEIEFDEEEVDDLMIAAEQMLKVVDIKDLMERCFNGIIKKIKSKKPVGTKQRWSEQENNILKRSKNVNEAVLRLYATDSERTADSIKVKYNKMKKIK